MRDEVKLITISAKQGYVRISIYAEKENGDVVVISCIEKEMGGDEKNEFESVGKSCYS